MAKRIGLAFGGGYDSTCILWIHLNRDMAAILLGVSREELDAAFPPIEFVVFSDPGAEFKATYANIEVARQMCQDAGLRFEVVRKKGETIFEENVRRGTLPVMAGAHHTCSAKFKIKVMDEWAAEQFPGDHVSWVVGIEADEKHRVTRFQASKDNDSIFPLVTLGINRAVLQDMVDAFWPSQVHKSSCVFCPFMSEGEIEDMILNNPEEWSMAKALEKSFSEASAGKHQAWLDAGKPLVGTKRPRAPKGMWSKDSWAAGQRLFAKKVKINGEKGRQLSVEEWEQRVLDSQEVAA